jgi:hypothetical protein
VSIIHTDLADKIVGELDGGEAEGGLVHQNVHQALQCCCLKEHSHEKSVYGVYLIYTIKSF